MPGSKKKDKKCKKYDVIVVGGGPAGTSCAIRLGKAGLTVLLVDQAQFPRDKPCGDAISPRLAPRLQELGVLHALEQLPHGTIQGLKWIHPQAGSFALRRPDTKQQGIICKRIDFDNLLFQEAKKYVEVLENCKVVDLIKEGDRVCGIKSKSKSFLCDIVIGADGAHSVVGKKLHATPFDEQHNAGAIRGYYEGVDGLSDCLELHFLDEVQPGYFWIFPLDVEKGLANVGLGVLSRELRRKRNNVNMKAVLERTLHQASFAQRFQNAQPVGKVMGWSLPFGSKTYRRAFDGCLLIGDAASLIDPLSGEGIENAIKSAEVAADVIIKAKKRDDFSLSSLARYDAQLQKLLCGEMRLAYMIQKIGRNKILLRWFFLLMKWFPWLRKPIASKFFN